MALEAPLLNFSDLRERSGADVCVFAETARKIENDDRATQAINRRMSLEAIAAQHDHAATHGQTSRQEIFAQLIRQIDNTQAS
jgi:hypothetical protein